MSWRCCYVLWPIGIVYGQLVNSMSIRYILCLLSIFFLVLVFCTEKNLATLLRTQSWFFFSSRCTAIRKCRTTRCTCPRVRGSLRPTWRTCRPSIRETCPLRVRPRAPTSTLTPHPRQGCRTWTVVTASWVRPSPPTPSRRRRPSDSGFRSPASIRTSGGRRRYVKVLAGSVASPECVCCFFIRDEEENGPVFFFLRLGDVARVVLSVWRWLRNFGTASRRHDFTSSWRHGVTSSRFHVVMTSWGHNVMASRLRVITPQSWSVLHEMTSRRRGVTASRRKV
jgi:hypothetical protein